MESISSSIFLPLKARSPMPSLQTTPESALYEYRTHSSIIFYLAAKRNMRIITVDCISIKGKASEFTASSTLHQTQHNVWNSTESRLKPRNTPPKMQSNLAKYCESNFLCGHQFSWIG